MGFFQNLCLHNLSASANNINLSSHMYDNNDVNLCHISNKYYYHSMQMFLPFHWPRAHHVTCKLLPTNNGVLMRNAAQLCLAANNILHMCKGNHAFLLLVIALA